MLETYTTEELGRLVGHEARDVNGEWVGYVDLIFVDHDTERPEWLGFWNGLPGGGRNIVPVRGIEVVEDELRLPWTKELVTSAPSYDEEDDRGLIFADPEAIAISPEKELTAYRHYGLDPSVPAQEGVVRLRALVVVVQQVD